MKMYVARPSKYKPFYRLEKPLEVEHTDEYGTTVAYANYNQKEVRLTEDEVEKISKITLDFLTLQGDLAFKFHGIEKYSEKNAWKEI